MHPDLAAIVAADEECRSRVTLAEERRERDLAAARAERDAVIARRAAAAREALESELKAIRADGDARLRELRDKQQGYLAALAAAGEKRFEEAVQIYLRIICMPEEPSR